MAEPSAVAFGRYLRSLRERRGLSLNRVSELTRGSPETLDKGTLSRLERGQQVPSLFKLGPLSRIYDVRPGALIERMELDREVERLGLETGGKSYDELHRLGGAALVAGDRKWEAYACFRDALPLAGEEKRVAAWSNLATAIRSLGRNELALLELEELEASGGLSPAQLALVHERKSNCHRCLGDMKRAEEYADSAAAEALSAGDSRTLAFAYNARANAALDQERWEIASDFLRRALAAYRESEQEEGQLLPSPSFQAQTLLMLADCSIHLGNVAHARRLALAAKRMGREHDLPLALAYSELLLGRIDEREGDLERALQRWTRAAAVAARAENRRLGFTALLEIFRQARKAGDTARARASRRRLERLAPWVPKHVPALREFERLIGQDGARSARATVDGGIHEQVQKTAGARAPAGPRATSGSLGRERRRPGGLAESWPR
ncbi:MAG: helix-turn-helix domain-containing protein [Acidobacteriia bacterium]|nr:helix-turn-helix domain-containing protein [Terriglobia bacterium]